MGGIHIYFDKENQKIIDRMGRGELSKVCQNAVNEWDSYNEDLEAIKKKIDFLKDQKNSTDHKLIFLEKRYADLKESEKEKIKAKKQRFKVENKNKEIEIRNKSIDRKVNYLRGAYILSNQDAKAIVLKYYKQIKYNKRLPFEVYTDKLELKIRKEKTPYLIVGGTKA